MTMGQSLSKKTLIIIPAYNEEGSIARVVEHIHKHVPLADILVVDDGSRRWFERQNGTEGKGKRGHGYQPSL